jgi:hypothetical protein
MKTWQLDAINPISGLLSAVAEHLPEAQTVSFEIDGPCREAREVFAKHHSQAKYWPLRDTISPSTELHYCTVSNDLARDLEHLLRTHKAETVLWHIKGFGDQKLLFAVHDADMGDSAFLSPHIDEKTIRAIANQVGCRPKLIQTKYDWDAHHKRARKK